MTKNKTLKKKNKIINLHSHWHLGDNIYIMIYLNNCKDYIVKNNIIVNLYIKEKYIKQVKEFKTYSNIHIHKIILDKSCIYNTKNMEVDHENIYDVLSDFRICKSNIPDNSFNSATIWHSPFNYFLKDFTIFKDPKHKYPLNKSLEVFFTNLGKKVGLPKLKKFEYSDPDLLIRHSKLKKDFKEADILVINSTPRSLQYDLKKHKKDFHNFIKKISNKYKVVTTEKVDDIPCTRDNNLSIKDIGAISTHVKYIVAINTGPVVPCLNTYTFKSVKKWFIFDNNMPFNYGNNWYINPTFDEILKEIDE